MIGNPGKDYQSPKRRHYPGSIYVYVDDVDAHFERAKAAGAEIVNEPERHVLRRPAPTAPRIPKVTAGRSRRPWRAEWATADCPPTAATPSSSGSSKPCSASTTCTPSTLATAWPTARSAARQRRRGALRRHERYVANGSSTRRSPGSSSRGRRFRFRGHDEVLLDRDTSTTWRVRPDDGRDGQPLPSPRRLPTGGFPTPSGLVEGQGT